MLQIITLSWQGSQRLSHLKDSLLPNLQDLDWQWIIKDNGSTDGTVDLVKSWENDRIKLIEYPNNLQNFSEGVNYCVNQIDIKDNDLILLLNNDIIFKDSSSIKNMISLINNDISIGVVGAKLIYPSGIRLQHAGVVFHPGHKNPIHFRAGELDDERAAKNREFQAVTGAVLLIRFSDFIRICTTNKSKLNGMDESLCWCFDDIDLCLSVRYNLVKKIVYCGQTNITHEESATLKKNPVNRLFMGQNVNYLREKWKGRYILDLPQYQQNPDYNEYQND